MKILKKKDNIFFVATLSKFPFVRPVKNMSAEVTGFSPFEVLFGRKANIFNDWQSSNLESDSLELERRSLEIKNLVEHFCCIYFF